MIGTGKTGHTTSDDGDFFAGVFTRWMKFQLMFQAIITNKLFNRINANVVLDLVAVATVLTGCRADSSHDGRKRIGLGNTIESVFLPGPVSRRFLDTANNI